MASTYSNLKIQLMATGENSGTWGNVTNVNLGTALEEAITGSNTVTFSGANIALTTSNVNTTQPFRNLRLDLTGTGVNPTTALTVPSIQKVYIINNGLGFPCEIKNATGSNVTVPAGKTMYVYNTGSNVVDAVTHLTSLTLGTPLAVAQGGTGSNTGTFSGANITTINANNISTGTLATARGGTGLNTFTANTAIYASSTSVLASGTLPTGGGGTGLTGFTAANNAIYSTSASALTAGTLPVTAGGTGSTTATGTGSVVLATTPTITTPVLTGMKETRVAMAANDINLLAGNYFSKTISTTTTFTVSNVATTGTSCSFILDLTNGGAATITWWTGTKWAGGTAPTLTASGRDVLGFFTYDGGTIWTGLVLAKDVK